MLNGCRTPKEPRRGGYFRSFRALSYVALLLAETQALLSATEEHELCLAAAVAPENFT